MTPRHWVCTAAEKWTIGQRLYANPIYIEFENHMPLLERIIADVAAAGGQVGEAASVEYGTQLALHPTCCRHATVLDAILRAHLWPWAPPGLPMAALCMCYMIVHLSESRDPCPEDEMTDPLHQVNVLYGISISKEEYDIFLSGYGDPDPMRTTAMVRGLTELLMTRRQ